MDSTVTSKQVMQFSWLKFKLQTKPCSKVMFVEFSIDVWSNRYLMIFLGNNLTCFGVKYKGSSDIFESTSFYYQ
jgi:hypothetical protein